MNRCLPESNMAQCGDLGWAGSWVTIRLSQPDLNPVLLINATFHLLPP